MLARERPWRRSVNRPELLTLGVCLLLTGAHAGYRRVYRPSGPAPIQVSTLAAGAVVPDGGLFGATNASTCRIVISFSPDCPFCKRAAQREKTADRSGSYATTTWIAAETRESLAAFTAGLPPYARHVVDAGLYRALGVRAVPGLYLLDDHSRVRWVGPYRGDEDTALLEARCAGGASQLASDSLG